VGDGRRRRIPAGVKTELEQVHEQLLARLDALEELARGSTPSRGLLSSTRYQLTRASGRRRKLLEERVYPMLLARLDGVAREAVRALRDSTATMVADSANHIHRWTIDEILDDWLGYCTASAWMRRQMRERIAQEQHVLYPLLDD